MPMSRASKRAADLKRPLQVIGVCAVVHYFLWQAISLPGVAHVHPLAIIFRIAISSPGRQLANCCFLCLWLSGGVNSEALASAVEVLCRIAGSVVWGMLAYSSLALFERNRVPRAVIGVLVLTGSVAGIMLVSTAVSVKAYCYSNLGHVVESHEVRIGSSSARTRAIALRNGAEGLFIILDVKQVSSTTWNAVLGTRAHDTILVPPEQIKTFGNEGILFVTDSAFCISSDGGRQWVAWCRQSCVRDDHVESIDLAVPRLSRVLSLKMDESGLGALVMEGPSKPLYDSTIRLEFESADFGRSWSLRP